MNLTSFVLCAALAQIPSSLLKATEGEGAAAAATAPAHDPAAAADPRGLAPAVAPPAVDRYAPPPAPPVDQRPVAPTAPPEAAAAPPTGIPPALAAPHESKGDAAGALVPLGPHTRRVGAVDLIEAALKIPEGSPVTGRPIALVEVLRSVGDRTSQFRATQSYWALAAALAEYHFASEELQLLERLKPASAPGERPSVALQLVTSRMAVANARLHDAELALTAAQYELASAIHLPVGQALPLPTDVPHVGSYKTEIDQLFVGMAIPARSVLIDRTLPIRHSAIDARAAAVTAAADALEVAEEGYFNGQTDVALVVTLADDVARQRRALLGDVRTYNDEIAEYAMTAPTRQMEAGELAAMLIKPTDTNRVATVAGNTALGSPVGGVERAGFNQPIGSPAAPLAPGGMTPIPESAVPLAPPPGFGAPVAPRAPNQPTLAPPRGAVPGALPSAPPAGIPPANVPAIRPANPSGAAPAPPATAYPPAGASEAAPYAPGNWEARRARTPAAGEAAARAAEMDLSEAPLFGSTPAENHEAPEAPRYETPQTPREAPGTGETEAPPTGAAPAPAAPSAIAEVEPSCLYPALQGMSPERQAKQLAQALCWGHAETEEGAKAITLVDYLNAAVGARRIDAITAYWQAERAAATVLALHQQAEQYESLGALLAARTADSSDASAAAAMLLVRAAQKAAEADTRRAEADRLTAEAALTTVAGRSLTGAWLAPSTTPHAGGYHLELGSLTPELRASPVVQRMSTTIPQMRETVVDHAAAVVATDRARGSVELGAERTFAATARAVESVREQTAETTVFLARLIDYNIEIARYADAVLPPATSNDAMVRALVTATADSH